MGLAGDLLALGACLRPMEEERGFGELDPRLRTCYSPRTSWFSDEYRGDVESERAALAVAVGAEAQPEALGLSIAPNSKRPPRYGLSGLPAAGRKQVSRSLALLEENRGLLSFWTVSLPTDALIALGRADTWPVFQDRVRKELVRKLQGAGLPALLVGVVELQPKRSLAAGFPCPHLHLVFQGRRSRGTGWVLSPSDLDAVIQVALATAGVQAPPGIDAASWLATAGNVQPVRKSVRAYLSKYMTKGSGDTERWRGTEAENLLPRQWWMWSRPMREFVLHHVLPIAFGFLAWVHAWKVEVEEAGLARFRVLPLDDPRAPLTYEINWLSCENLAALIALWQEDEWDEEWHRAYRLRKHRVTE